MSSFIPVSEAAAMNARFRQNRESMLRPEYQGKNVLFICETFEKSQVDTLLSKEGCVGLRIYLGMDEDMLTRAVLVAVNAANEDMLPLTQASRGGGDDSTLETGQRCPEECPPGSILNEP